MEQQKLVRTEPIEQLVNKIGADTVFGTPTTENGTMIIPVAQAEFGFGYGGGYGHSPTSEQNSDNGSDGTHDAAEGGGGGGGGGGRATPRGYIRVSSDEVTYDPIVDETRVPMAALLLAAWSVFWIMATVRTIANAVAKTKQMRIKKA